MELDNTYSRRYERLIAHRRANPVPGHTIQEAHHIRPRCLGGTNEAYNLVSLTPREHFIAHKLLTKMFSGEPAMKMQRAFTSPSGAARPHVPMRPTTYQKSPYTALTPS